MLLSQSRWSTPADAGPARPRKAAVRPLAMMVANPNFVIFVPSSFFCVGFEPCGLLLRFTGSGFFFRRYALLNREVTGLIPMAAIGRRVAEMHRLNGPKLATQVSLTRW